MQEIGKEYKSENSLHLEGGCDENEIKIKFEEVLNQEVGEFGQYQLRNILLALLSVIFTGFLTDYLFTAGKLPHRCAVPVCDDINKEYAPEWILNAIPKTSTGFDDCSRYENITISSKLSLNGTCPSFLFDRNNVVSCDNYVYERTNTVVYDFGLECQEWLRALSGTLNSLGGMFALPLAGYVSDNFGRRISMILFGCNIALIGCIRAFSVNYTMYVTLQFLHTAFGGGLYSAAYILATEIVGSKYRIYASASMSSTFAFGQALLGLIASQILEWRTLTITLFSPLFIIISYYWLITESPRWLLSKHKTQQAKKTLQHAAKLNGKVLTELSTDFLLNAIPKPTENLSKTNLLKRVLNSRVMLRRCCTTPCYWITTTFIYYGLSINSVNMSGNMYLNYILSTVIEIPGYWTAVLVLEKIGRKTTLFSGFILCGICCFSFAFMPKHVYGLSLFVYLFGKYCTGLIFTSLYLFTTELYPTRNRHSFLGFSSMIGRVGSIMAPLTPPLMIYWTGLPSILFGVMSTITAFLILTQPETRGKKIPDTFEEAENIK